MEGFKQELKFLCGCLFSAAQFSACPCVFARVEHVHCITGAIRGSTLITREQSMQLS